MSSAENFGLAEFFRHPTIDESDGPTRHRFDRRRESKMFGAFGAAISGFLCHGHNDRAGGVLFRD